MKIKRTERDYYAVQMVTNPETTGVLEASFDGGQNWVTGVLDETEVWTTWLVAGPDYDAAAVGQDPADTQAVIRRNISPLIRRKDDPVLLVEDGPKISFT